MVEGIWQAPIDLTCLEIESNDADFLTSLDHLDRTRIFTLPYERRNIRSLDAFSAPPSDGPGSKPVRHPPIGKHQ